MENKMIYYFGYGTNRNTEMMAAIIGRDHIEGTKGKMLGHELCIQKMSNIPDIILPNSSSIKSPRSIFHEIFGDDFRLYITRPKINGVTYGMIWQITPEEYEMVRDWELIELGLQEDVSAVAIDENGKLINVVTPGSLNPNLSVDMIISDDKYDDYIVDKQHILEVGNESRREYLEKTR